MTVSTLAARPAAAGRAAAAPARSRSGRGSAGRVPPVGLGRPDGAPEPSGREAELLRALGAGPPARRVHLAEPGRRRTWRAALETAAAWAPSLELALFLARSTPATRAAVGGARRRRRRAGPRRTGRRPHGAPARPRPAGLVELVRDRLGLAGVPVAGGTDMYFCEVNRTRPRWTRWTASSGRSTRRCTPSTTLPGRDARGPGRARPDRARYHRGKPVFVGPVTLKRRYNVNATVAEGEEAPASFPTRSIRARRRCSGPPGRRRASSTWPRRRVGRDLLRDRRLARRPPGRRAPAAAGGVPGPAGQVFPLYHVLADVAEWRDAECSAARRQPLEIVGLAVRAPRRDHLLVANLTPHAHDATVSGLTGGAVSAGSARRPPSPPCSIPGVPGGGGRRGHVRAVLELEPFETVRIDVRP